METNGYHLFQLLERAKTERQVVNETQASAEAGSHHRFIYPCV